MSNNEGAFGVMYVKLKPHLLMVLVQLVLSFLYFLVEASLNKAMNPHVFVTYRHAVGGIVVLPFAYIRERLEVVDVKNTRGLAKVFGTVLSLIGALIMTLYEGHTIHSLQGAPLHVRGNLVHKNWIKGSILSVASCISWSLWYILQSVLILTNTLFIRNILPWTTKLMLFAWLVGNHSEEISSTTVTNSMDKLHGCSTVCCLYCTRATQAYSMLLWGKETDRDYKSQQSSPTLVEQKECRIQIKTSAEQEVPQRNVSHATN
ncbi:Auxin-induced protein 5NG4 [Glycine soja]|nr:Auxin-induced protein 5NG4 [Glycine soja]